MGSETTTGRRIGAWLDRLHLLVGRSQALTRVAVKVRNQCDAAISAALNDGTNPFSNGELWLIRRLSGRLHRFIDVGANVGSWTSLVLEYAPAAAGLCFEPAPSALSQLRRHAPEWKNVRIVPKAVSDGCGTMQFLDLGVGSEISGDASVVGTSSSVGELVSVPAVTLDSECEALGWTEIDLLKIDAEGLDWKVLRGAENLLKGGSVRVVQFEYGAYWIASGGTLAATIGVLDGCGYRVSRLRRWGRSPVDLASYGEYFGYSNFVAVRKGDEELLGPERSIDTV